MVLKLFIVDHLQILCTPTELLVDVNALRFPSYMVVTVSRITIVTGTEYDAASSRVYTRSCATAD